MYLLLYDNGTVLLFSYACLYETNVAPTASRFFNV